jgi:ABC-2 type transport system permease protein
MWKEWREVQRMQGGKKASIALFLGLGFMGIFIPYQMGTMWVDSPVILGVFAWLTLVVISMVIADSFAGERERHTLETLLASRLSNKTILFGKAAIAVLYGWGSTMFLLILGLIVVNIAHGHGKFLFYKPIIAWGAPVICLLTAVFATGIGILISLRASTVKQAQQNMSFILIFLWITPTISLSLIPRVWRTKIMELAKGLNPNQVILIAFCFLILLDILIFAAALARFKRAKLILD